MNLILKRSLLIGTILFAFSFTDTAIAAESEPLVGWHLVDGQEKYFENNQIVTGMRKIGSTTYLFNSNGIKQTGWHQLNGKDYYFDPNSNGGMITGKRKIGNTTYLLHNNGYKVYGWHQLNGKDYYFDPNYGGGMVTGKRTIGKTTYLMHNDGYKTYSWHQLAGKEYYFDRNYGGGMVTGKRKIGNTTYLLHNNGYKIYGWSRLNGKEYYFDPNHGGGMVTGERRVEKSVYLFNSDGSKNKYLKLADKSDPKEVTYASIIEKKETVPFEVVEIMDEELLLGESKITQKGSKGYTNVTYEVKYINGKEVSRKETNKEIIKPVDQVKRIGTKIAVTSINIKNKKSEMYIGEEDSLAVEVTPENATIKDISWTSSNSSVISIDEKGNIQANGIGVAELTATTVDGGVSDSISVEVVPVLMESLEINTDTTSLLEMETLQLTPAIFPEKTTNKNLTWTSSNEKIATVDINGLITGIKAGNVTITVKNEDGSLSDTISLEIKKPKIVSSETLYYTITQYDSFELPKTLTVELSNGFSKEVNLDWGSSVVDSSEIGTFTFNAHSDYYDYNITLTLVIGEFVPDIRTNAYSMFTVNGLSKTLSIGLSNYEYATVNISKIELYERGRLYKTYSAEALESSGINTTVSGQNNWGITINFALGMYLDNSYAKYYTTVNGKEYVFEDYLD